MAAIAAGAAAGIITIGDTTSWEGLFVALPMALSYTCGGSLGNELLSWENDARSEKELAKIKS